MKKIVLLSSILFMAVLAYSQNPPASPRVTAEGKNVKVAYGQPSKKGRVIFGELEPYGKVWRAGANNATEITFAKDGSFGGMPVKAGTYTLFAIPNEKEWTIILNKEVNQMGAFNYQESKDQLRVKVPSSKTPAFVETFNIAIGKDDVQLKWENTAVAFKVKG